LVDRRTGNSYALGAEDRCLLQLLEQDKTLDEVGDAFQAVVGRTIRKRHIREFIENLRQLRLLDDEADSHHNSAATNGSTPGSPDVARRHDPAAKLNFRFDLAALLFGWIMHPVWIGPVLVLGGLAANVAVRHWDEMVGDLAQMYQAFPLALYVLLVVAPRLLVLNLMQALLVGMTCRRFGGRVRGFGIAWWGGVVPYFRTDVGDSLALMDDRGRRTMVYLGFWTAATLCTVACVGWATATSEAKIFWLLFVVPGLLRLLVHLNIFFEHSTAYLWLCDKIGEWQLLKWAREETKAWFGFRVAPRPLSDRERFWLRGYGLAYYAYRMAAIAVTVFVAFWWVMPEYQLPGAIFVLAFACWWNRDLLPGSKA